MKGYPYSHSTSQLWCLSHNNQTHLQISCSLTEAVNRVPSNLMRLRVRQGGTLVQPYLIMRKVVVQLVVVVVMKDLINVGEKVGVKDGLEGGSIEG